MMNRKTCFLNLLLGLLLIIASSCCCRDKQCLRHGYEGNGGDLFGKADLYHAVLPCASCPGIDTWVQLYKGPDGMRFRMVEKYLEEEDAVFINEGQVLQKSETIIQLQRKDGIQSYLVEDDSISLLGFTDIERDRIGTIAGYRLYKLPAFLKK